MIRSAKTLVFPAFISVLSAACALRIGDDGSNGDGSSTDGTGNADYGKPPSGSSASSSSAGVGGADPSTSSAAMTAASSSGSGSSGGGGPSATSVSSASATASASSSASAGATTGSGGGGCYADPHDAGASLADLKASYTSSGWLTTMLKVLDRRFDTGWFVVDAMKNDPWLKNDLPSYYSMATWSGMIEAIDTACHEETHGYDFDQALKVPGKHVYFHGPAQALVVPKLDFFPRQEILSEVQTGGSVTPSYDKTYLTGTQGTYGFIFLADELTAYINGLACVTAVVDHLDQGSSFRDGVASHLYYLEVYLRVARTKHPGLYAQWKADPSWQKFVRLAWARGRYWYTEALPYPLLGSKDAPIWARVEAPENRDEIALFTGEDPDQVACSP